MTSAEDIVKAIYAIAEADDAEGKKNQNNRNGKVLFEMLKSQGLHPKWRDQREFIRIYNSIRFIMSGRVLS